MKMIRFAMIAAFLTPFVLPALAKEANPVDVNQLASSLNREDGDPELLSIALLMIDLYDKGLAGHNTGICMDYVNDHGTPKLNLGLSTDAFVTNSSLLIQSGTIGREKALSKKAIGFDVDKFSELLGKLSRRYGGDGIQYTVTGFADGQHFKDQPNIEKSVQSNRELAKNRAEAVKALLPKVAADHSVTDGKASPNMEELFRSDGNGQRCDVRRKVVISLKPPLKSLEPSANGVMSFSPSSMDPMWRAGLQDGFRSRIRGAMKSLISKPEFATAVTKEGRLKTTDRTVEKRAAETIYKDLEKDGVLASNCASPFRESALAFISFMVSAEDSKWTAKEYVHSYLQGFEKKQGTVKVSGDVTFQQGAFLACIVPNQSELKELAQKTDFALPASEYLKRKGIELGEEGVMKVGFDVDSLKEDEFLDEDGKGGLIPSTGRKKEEIKTRKGFYCHACQRGFFFTNTAHQYHPVYRDRTFNYDEGGQGDGALQTAIQTTAENNPLSGAAFLTPKLYVIRQCPSCKCDYLNLIRQKSPSVTAIDPMITPKNKLTTEVQMKELDSTCVIRPPLMHSCGVEPNDQRGEVSVALNKNTRWIDLNGAIKDAEAIQNMLSGPNPGVCIAEPISPKEKIASVSCGTSKIGKLPTPSENKEDELKDCPPGARVPAAK